MSWSDGLVVAGGAGGAPVRRATVLDAAALAALAAQGGAQAPVWQPHATGGAATGAIASAAAGAAAPLAAFDDFLPLDADALASVDSRPAPSASPDTAFGDALPDLARWIDEDGAVLGVHGMELVAALEQQAAVREEVLRAELEQAMAERAASDAARHEQELQQAYEAGLAAGYAEGEQAARQALAEAMATLDAARAQLAAQEERWLGNLQENLAVLACAVARHVIVRDCATDDAIVRARVAEAVAEFPLDEPITVRVHPTDLVVLKPALDGTRTLRWLADERIARGGCLVEGRERIVDGRVDVALERVYRALSGQHA